MPKRAPIDVSSGRVRLERTTFDAGEDLVRRLNGNVRETLAVARDGRRLAVAFAPSPRESRRIGQAIRALETADGARLRFPTWHRSGLSGAGQVTI